MDKLGPLPPDAYRTFSALASPQRLAIALHLWQTGPASFSELCKIAKRKPGATSPHLNKLQEGGLLRRAIRMKDGEVREAYDLTGFGKRFLANSALAYQPVEIASANSQTVSTSSLSEVVTAVPGGQVIDFD